MPAITTVRRRRLLIAAVTVIVGLFTATRVGILLTSFDQNRNWEESVFLFSALDLKRVGVAHVWDYQDDLNHGGSIPLILVAIPWTAILGTSLVGLKGVAIAWALAAVISFIGILWRYCSPFAAIYGSLLVTLASPTMARLNVTLVGSHPEAILPALLTLAVYLEWTRPRNRGSRTWTAALVGLFGGLATWMSLMAVPWIAPLVTGRILWAERRVRDGSVLAGGGLLGFSPWLYQNTILRPHGALMWRSKLRDAQSSLTDSIAVSARHLVDSFGVGMIGGITVLLLLLVPAVIVLSRSTNWVRIPGGGAAGLALFAPPLLTFASLCAASLPVDALEGYYYYRFYAALQMQLFLLGSVALDLTTSQTWRWLRLPCIAVPALMGLWFVAPLFGTGNTYRADVTADFETGCLIHGIAEYDRAGSPVEGIRRLMQLPPDRDCRRQGLSGLGWGMGERFVRSGDVDELGASLAAVEDRDLRFRACGGVIFVLSHPKPLAKTRPFPSELLPLCARS